MASTKLCPALDLLPMELWVKVLKHPLPPELKAIRAVSPSLEAAAAKHLFHELRFRPTVQSTDKVRGITDPGNHKAPHRYVKSIEFDIEPLYDEKTLGWMRRGNRLIPAYNTLLHFGTRAFRDAIKVFQHVHTIKITTNRLCARSYPHGLDKPSYAIQSIIFQVLEIVHLLKSTVHHIEILSGGVAQINLSDFMFGPYEHAHIEDRIPAMPRLPNLTEKKVNATLAQLPPLRSLNINLFDMAYGRLPREDLTLYGLKTMLSRSAPELISLSFSLATPGEHPGMFHRNNCWSHRRDDPAFRIYWTDLFGDTAYPKLAKISLRNVAYFGEEVGQYLRDNASILQSVHLATWDCKTALPPRDFVHALWNASKEALSLLTLEACGDQHKQLCSAQECGDHIKRYYTINAAKLAEMMLFQNTPTAALERVIFYELLMGIEDSDRSWWYRTSHIGRPHFTCLESGAQAVTYRKAMETLTADELSYRGTVKEQLVLEYDQAIKNAGSQRMGIDLLHWVPNMQLFVFIFNDEPSLFLWTK